MLKTQNKICSLNVTYFKLYGLVIQDVLFYINKISAYIRMPQPLVLYGVGAVWFRRTLLCCGYLFWAYIVVWCWGCLVGAYIVVWCWGCLIGACIVVCSVCLCSTLDIGQFTCANRNIL